MNEMYEVQWYEYNLTESKCRKFFTARGATLFAWFMELKGINAKIYVV
jgi:hypothetical protein